MEKFIEFKSEKTSVVYNASEIQSINTTIYDDGILRTFYMKDGKSFLIGNGYIEIEIKHSDSILDTDVIGDIKLEQIRAEFKKVFIKQIINK